MAQIPETSDTNDLNPSAFNSMELSSPRQISAQYQTIVRFQGGTYIILGLILVTGIGAITQSFKQTDQAATLGLTAVGLGMIIFAGVYLFNQLGTPRVTG